MAELEETVARLDLRLEPIAKRPIDLSDPAWQEKLRAAEPLDEAGIRAEAEEALRALLDRYEHGDDETRTAVRAMFDRYSSFCWAAHLPGADFRTRLLHLSARDHGRDTRDEILALNDLCTEARAAGVDIGPLLREVADLSSTVDKYGMGSMRDILLRCAG
ncbi:hypothetical protein [Amycolatopsis sp. RTGN1]|uniref:hypothetical protein n=1 Tax=Amycolatopsis ponsaeliensis TaxID=2992142 RepID=UPI00254EBBCD|nr:hypothetical protein [Amycolatopsis sp. RTGN1]